MKKTKKTRVWEKIDVKYHLSHQAVQMLMELGLNLKKLGRINNHEQEAWKEPPEFINTLYEKRFKSLKLFIENPSLSASLSLSIFPVGHIYLHK